MLKDFSDLYIRNEFYSDELLRNYSQLNGMIKKKKKKTGPFSFKDSNLKYFCFHLKGRFLCYYDSEPTPTSKPRNVIDVLNISEIKENYQDKLNHFALLVLGKHIIHLKIENYDQIALWINAIRKLREFYFMMGFRSTTQEYKEPVSDIVMLKILAENESRNPQYILDKINKPKSKYSTVLRDKGLLEILQKGFWKSFKNRIAISKIKKRTDNKKKKLARIRQSFNIGSQSNSLFNRKDSGHSNDNGSVNSKNSMNLIHNFKKMKPQTFTTYYIFLISQKPISQLDEEYYQTDDEVLSTGILPSHINFNEVLFYEHQLAGDDSQQKKQFKVENIQSVSITSVKKEKLEIKITLDNSKIYLIEFNTAIETLVWLEGLERSRKTQLELQRCLLGPMKYNIDIIYEQFERNSEDYLHQLVRTITKDIDGEMNVPDFLPSLDSCVDELNFFCDAFYAHSVFIKEVFSQGVKAIHSKVRQEMMEFWNKNYLDMDAGEIINFGSLVFRYTEVLRKWKVGDARMIAFNKPVISTFCLRLFDNSKDLMFKVINDAMFKCSLNQKNIFVNDVFRNLENHVNLCFENYDQIPTLPTAHNLIDMIMTIVTVVQINLISQVSDDDKKFEVEVLISLVNNDFQKLINNLMKKIHKKTRYKITINDIRGLINYKYLQRNSQKLSHICLKKLSKDMGFKVKVLYMSLHGKFEEKGVVKFLNKMNKEYEGLFLGLKEEYQKYNLLESVCEVILGLYFDQFLTLCGALSHRNIKKTIEKIKNDKTQFLVYLQPYIDHGLDWKIEVLQVMVDLLETDHPTKTIVSILKLLSFFGDEALNIDNISRLIQSKIYFSDYQRETLKKSLSKDLKTHEQQKRNTNMNRRYVPIRNPFVLRFCTILLNRWRKKDRYNSRSTTVNFRPQNAGLMYEKFSINRIFNFETICKVAKFPIHIDDLEVSNHLEEYFRNMPKIHEVSIKFSLNSFQVKKLRSGRSMIADIRYREISCLNKFRKHSLYLKSNDVGLCLIFDEEHSDAGKECYKYLLTLQDRNSVTENEIEFDLTGEMPELFFCSEDIRYTFSYNNYVEELIDSNISQTRKKNFRELRPLGLTLKQLKLKL